MVIATNQPVVGTFGDPQRELVAVTIRGSVLFICSMKANFSFCRYMELDWIEVKPYSPLIKCAMIIFYNEKMQKK